MTIRISDEEFVKSYLEHYNKVTFFQWMTILLLGSTSNGHKRVARMMRRGIKLPRWQGPPKVHTEEVGTLNRLIMQKTHSVPRPRASQIISDDDFIREYLASYQNMTKTAFAKKIGFYGSPNVTKRVERLGEAGVANLPNWGYVAKGPGRPKKKQLVPDHVMKKPPKI